MFSIKDFTILSWGKNRDLHGIIMQDRGERFAVTAVVEDNFADRDVLSERIKKCYQDLAPSKDSVIILTGHIDQGIYLELKLPFLKSSELDQLLKFELSHRIPLDVEDLIWTHDVIEGTHDEESGKVTVRVFAVPLQNWTQIISELQLSGVKADLFIPVFMSAKRDGEYFFPTMNSEFSLTASNKFGLREFSYSLNPSDGIPNIASLLEHNKFAEKVMNPRFIPAVLCGAYIMKKGFKQSTSAMSLPKAMQPQRLRSISRFFFATVVIAAIIMFSVGFRMYMSTHNRLSALINEQEWVEERVDKLTSIDIKNALVNTKLQQMNEEEFGETELLHILSELTQLLPNGMRLTNFSLRNRTIDLSVVGEGNSDAVIQDMRSNPRFDVLSVRKRNLRGVTSINVQLGIAKDVK